MESKKTIYNPDDTKKQRVIYFDILNILACISVIYLHHNSTVHAYADTIVWREALVAQIIFYWAVPVFVMISGANLMNYRTKYSTKDFFKKRLSKVLIPWLFWAVVMLVWKIKTGRYELEVYSAKEIINVLLNSRMEPIYWFFPMIIGLYLIVPLLSHLADEKYSITLWYVVVCFCIMNATVPLFCEVFHIDWNMQMSVPVSGFVVFFILGHLLSITDIKREIRWAVYLFALVCSVLRYFGILIHSSRLGIRDDIFFNYSYVFSFSLAVAVFIFIKQINWDAIINTLNRKINSLLRREKALVQVDKLFAKLAGCSLGIYLIQRFIMEYELQFFSITNENLLWRTIAPFLTYIIALTATLIMKKIPLIKRLVP